MNVWVFVCVFVRRQLFVYYYLFILYCGTTWCSETEKKKVMKTNPFNCVIFIFIIIIIITILYSKWTLKNRFDTIFNKRYWDDGQPQTIRRIEIEIIITHTPFDKINKWRHTLNTRHPTMRIYRFQNKADKRNWLQGIHIASENVFVGGAMRLSVFDGWARCKRNIKYYNMWHAINWNWNTHTQNVMPYIE